MAAGKKKATRKKTTARKAGRKKAARKKTTRKKTARKKAARKKTTQKKTAAKKAAPKKAARGKAVAKPAKPKPVESVPAEDAAPKSEDAKIAAAASTRIGIVTHYFGRVGAGVIAIESGELRVGDTIHVHGHTTDFYQRVNRIEIDHAAVEVATAGQSVGVEITQRVREHDEVFKVSD
jgi:hypothetical protein